LNRMRGLTGRKEKICTISSSGRIAADTELGCGGIASSIEQAKQQFD
jgi:hypothetical protein